MTLIRVGAFSRSLLALGMTGFEKVTDDDWLIRGAEKGSVELIQDSLKRGANTESTAKGSTWTPLMIVAEQGNVKAAEVLVNAGANIDYKSSRGMSPLLVAIAKDNIEMAEFLLKCGAEMHTNYEVGNSPRDNAKTEEMKELLDRYDSKLSRMRRKDAVEDIISDLNGDVAEKVKQDD